MKFHALLWISLLAIAAAGCKEDEKITNSPPETKLFVDSINLSGENRLLTLVKLHWSGEDRDGFVVAYEISLDNTNWARVTVTDTLFSFSLPPNADTADIDFWVRAVDDDGMVDPTPASLKVPVKNTPPVAQFQDELLPTDTVLCVATLTLTFSDIEGDATVQQFEVKLNDGDWFTLPTTATTISFRSTSPTATGPTTASVFTGLQNQLQQGTINDYRLNDTNVVYLRVRDQGGLYSTPDTSNTFFVLNQRSEMLVLDNWATNPRPRLTYLPILESPGLYGDVDYLDLTSAAWVPKSGNVTLDLLFALYDNIFWFANRVSLGQFEGAEALLLKHLNKQGKLLAITELPQDLQNQSALFRIVPIDSIPTNDRNAYLPTAAAAGLLDAQPGTGYPDIANLNSAFITGMVPFYPQTGVEILYTANVTTPQGQPWPVTNTFFIRSKVGANTNLVFGTVPLHRMNNTPALTNFFETIRQEFNW